MKSEANMRYIMENEEIESPEGEIEKTPPPDFNVGDLCVTRVPLKRKFGVIPTGTTVEVKRKFVRSRKVYYEVQTLPCGKCDMVLTLTIENVPIDSLEDYETVYPGL